VSRGLPVVLVLAAALGSTASAQDTKPASAESRPQAYDLTVSDLPRNVIVEVVSTAKGKVLVKSGATELAQAVDHKGKWRWLDEVGDLNAKPVVCRRTFLEAHVSDVGGNKDPGLEGMTLVSTHEGVDVKVKAEGGRRALNETLRAQIAQAGAMGLFTILPGQVVAGARFPFEAHGLIALLLDSDGKLRDFEGDLLLERVDAGTNRAFISSSIGFVEDLDKEGASFSAKYRVAFSMEVDLTRHEVVKAGLLGQAKVEGRGQLEGKVEGEVEVEGRATAKPAAEVAALKKKAPSFRENVHRFAGVELKLPSCWLPINTKPELKTFLDGRVTPDVVIQINKMDDKVDPSSNEFIASLKEGFAKDNTKVVVQKASCPIGKACSFEFVNAKGTAVRGYVVAHPGGLLQPQLVGAADAVKKVEPELKAMVQSMKKAKG
jgi:hypothetical protein